MWQADAVGLRKTWRINLDNIFIKKLDQILLTSVVRLDLDLNCSGSQWRQRHANSACVSPVSRLPRVEYQEVWSGNQTKLSPCLRLTPTSAPAPGPTRVSRKRLQFRLLWLSSWFVFFFFFFWWEQEKGVRGPALARVWLIKAQTWAFLICTLVKWN